MRVGLILAKSKRGTSRPGGHSSDSPEPPGERALGSRICASRLVGSALVRAHGLRHSGVGSGVADTSSPSTCAASLPSQTR